MTTLNELRQGNDYSIPIALVDSAGVAVDTTSGVVKFRARKIGETTLAIDKFSPANGISIVSAAGGTSTLTIAGTEVDALELGAVYDWELLLTDSLGQDVTYETGQLKILESLF